MLVEILFLLFWLTLLTVVVGAVLAPPLALLYLVAVAGRYVWRRVRAAVPAPSGELRAGDAERSLVLRRVGEHFALGRITLVELEDRCSAVWEARTLGDLAHLEADLPPLVPRSPLARYRPWLYGAAAYNLAWGSVVVVAPGLFAGLLGRAAVTPVLWQVVGMLVLVYAPGYWWAARRPDRHAHLVAVGMLGKLLGPAGFLCAAATGALPIAFGLVILTNDVIWWPAFALYLRAAARLRGGWAALLAG
jgi:hypothetical protein